MSEDTTTPPTEWGPMRSFGRIKSRKLKPLQATLFDTLLPEIEATDERVALALASGRDIWLEIGFGGGEHLAAQALKHPDVTFIGCEPFLNGVGSVLRHIEDGGLKNVLILAGDARPLLDKLPDTALSRIFILFADPWPKARHNKRRFIQPETVATFARALKPGGSVRFATDWADYADWALERFLANPDLDWRAGSPADWNNPPADHVTTRYEVKKLGDCAPVFLDFYRR
ncbi:tRNA (guanosine(46)-N7)-methyltransferase TrmB [Asticcacaulis benevestitus]|uniref:tRNA (guanine-N(7)-)-methyltransferase n=1 Tax=Asticcacaulis benevestitus DSM 16100 = ATCC BAA-896 TaxID=1121022 RepID=V4PTG4_9CAUL|nr:tRNA (guanosine(46)-N7)-methyltransferase TrmB [Asticcacaulis benevestitus]ESQ91596.1 tRNA (guanine-N(7)-)-methyltransferase [Asticcacaulis benevestitus DSM 16100 = ATCC BAA-896]